MSFGRLAGSGFESVTLGAFGAMVALGAVFWAIGSLGRRRGLTGETELVTEQAAASGTGPGQ